MKTELFWTIGVLLIIFGALAFDAWYTHRKAKPVLPIPEEFGD